MRSSKSIWWKNELNSNNMYYNPYLSYDYNNTYLIRGFPEVSGGKMSFDIYTVFLFVIIIYLSIIMFILLDINNNLKVRK